MKVLQGTGDDLADSGDLKDSKSFWLVKLLTKTQSLIQTLPTQLQLLHRTSQSITNPLFRFLEREVTVASQLLDTVRNDLLQLKEMCKGERKSTNVLKQLAQELHADLIPKKWRRFNIANITATEWLEDFKKRIEQLAKVSSTTDYGKRGLWFGGLLFPEAFMTATRQSIAQDNKWSLEELELKFEVDPSDEAIKTNDLGFIVEGLSIEGASYARDEQRIKLSEALSSFLPRANLKWVNKAKAAQEEGGESI